jgi:hypothetical protein
VDLSEEIRHQIEINNAVLDGACHKIEAQSAMIADLQASKGLLAQIAESFGKKKGVDAAPKV